MKEFRNTKPYQLTLDAGFKVDPFQFTGSIDETQPTTAARVADGSLQVVPNGTAAAVGGGPTLPAPALGGVELGYAEITANWSSAFAANQIIAITGLSIAVTVGKRPIKIETQLQDILSSVASTDVTALIYEDGNPINAQINVMNATANKRTAFNTAARRSPAAGPHTYELRIKTLLAATLTVEASAISPGFIQVVEV